MRPRAKIAVLSFGKNDKTQLGADFCMEMPDLLILVRDILGVAEIDTGDGRMTYITNEKCIVRPTGAYVL